MVKKDIDDKLYDCFNTLLKGIVIGFFSIYVIIYSLRPSKLNPDIVLEIIENKIIFIPLVIINYYLFIWHSTIGVLFLIFLISLVFDYYIYIENDTKQNIKNNFSKKISIYIEQFRESIEKM